MAIIADDDMEIILKGSQEKVIRNMLDNRLFCLIKMPAQKPERCISKCSSSVFVGFMNGMDRSFAIRKEGSKTVYEKCEYYLSVFSWRGTSEEYRGYFEDGLKRRQERGGSLKITYPTTDELMSFLDGKELVLITNWMHYGSMESYKVDDFLKSLLFIWKECGSDYLRRDEYCDIRVYLNRIDKDGACPEHGLYGDDVREFDIREQIVNVLRSTSEGLYGKENFYTAEFETQDNDIQAAYFLTRFHSNTAWDADPVNVVNCRLSVFVLPSTISPRKAKDTSDNKKTTNKINGVEYVIDSIHCNSDIFTDVDEFKKYVFNYFDFFAYD